jgi:hypothetical protein
MSMDRGIKRQMTAAKKGMPAPKFSPLFKLAPAPHLPNDGKAGPTAKSNEPYEMNTRRISQLNNLKPNWR